MTNCAKPRCRRRRWLLIGGGLLLAVAAGGFGVWRMIHMPGKSYSGPLPPLTPEQTRLAEELRRDVHALAEGIGVRCATDHPANLAQAAEYLGAALQAAGCRVARQQFGDARQPFVNVSGEVPGSVAAGEVLVVGAHYDTIPGCPGANDNASGCAAVLALARTLAHQAPQRTIRFVCFANEEWPFYHTEKMGSLVYAQSCRERRERIVGMFSLETIGYYTDAPGSQQYPAPLSRFYPDVGNFIGFVGHARFLSFTHQVVASFRRHAAFPSEGIAGVGWISGLAASDHWAFWEQGYPAVMVTDTAMFRYPHYHLPTDTPERLDYERLARVVAGLSAVVADLARAAPGLEPLPPSTSIVP